MRIFHHEDLDGYGSAILVHDYFLPPDNASETISCFVCDYDDVDDTIRQNFDPNDFNVIVDITPSKSVCAWLDTMNDKVLLVDHHKTKSWVAQYSWAHFYDETYCATSALLHMMHTSVIATKQKVLPTINDEEVIGFVNAVRAWDCWLLDSPHRQRGEDLHRLFKFLGGDEFMSVMQRYDVDTDISDPTFLYIRSVLRQRALQLRNDIVQRAQKENVYTDSEGRTYMMLVVSTDAAFLGHAILESSRLQILDQHIDYVVTINVQYNRCSLYSREDEDVDVGKIAERLHGGGHMHAAGFFFNVSGDVKRIVGEKLSDY